MIEAPRLSACYVLFHLEVDSVVVQCSVFWIWEVVLYLETASLCRFLPVRQTLPAVSSVVARCQKGNYSSDRVQIGC